ncbi:MAG: flagellar biosynthetic protein FliO [Desulfopila sp.]
MKTFTITTRCCWSGRTKRSGIRPMVQRISRACMVPCMVLILDAGTAHAAAFDPVSSSLRMLWGLLVVLVIMLGLYYLLRKRFSSLQQQGKGAINIIETKHLMPKKSLMLVEVRGREYLVGLGADSVTTIVPLQSNDLFASVLEDSREQLKP